MGFEIRETLPDRRFRTNAAFTPEAHDACIEHAGMWVLVREYEQRGNGPRHSATRIPRMFPGFEARAIGRQLWVRYVGEAS